MKDRPVFDNSAKPASAQTEASSPSRPSPAGPEVDGADCLLGRCGEPPQRNPGVKAVNPGGPGAKPPVFFTCDKRLTVPGSEIALPRCPSAYFLAFQSLDPWRDGFSEEDCGELSDLFAWHRR